MNRQKIRALTLEENSLVDISRKKQISSDDDPASSALATKTEDLTATDQRKIDDFGRRTDCGGKC
jgi:hypothetical protein